MEGLGLQYGGLGFRKFSLGVYYGLGFGSRLRVEGSGWVFGVEGLGFGFWFIFSRVNRSSRPVISQIAW